MLTRHLSLFGCLAAVSVTPLGCGQTLQMTQSCCSPGQDALHLSVSLSLTHTPSPAFFAVYSYCALVSECVSVHLCRPQEVYRATDWGKKNDGVFCLQVPGLHASCVFLRVWAQMCVSACVWVCTHGSQFLFLMSALCCDEQIIWADFCPGCFTQTED